MICCYAGRRTDIAKRGSSARGWPGSVLEVLTIQYPPISTFFSVETSILPLLVLRLGW